MANPNRVSLNEKELLALHKNTTGGKFEQAPGLSTASKSDSHDQINCRLGDSSCAKAHAEKLQRTVRCMCKPSPNSLLHLQRNYGNQFVGQVLGLARKIDLEHGAPGREMLSRNLHLQARQDEGEAAAGSEVESAIDRSRGGGQALDANMSLQMNSAFNADFSGVRVHTGPEADSMNRGLNAKAFTTGQDIFFRQGEYNTGSSGGRELLAHELTHVAQQNPETVQRKDNDESFCGPGGNCASGSTGTFQAKLTVGSPGDIYEQEADQMAKTYSQWEHQGASRSESDEKIRRQSPEEEKKEEEKPMMAKAENGSMLLRQPEAEQEEEEKVQTKLHNGELRRQTEEEQEE